MTNRIPLLLFGLFYFICSSAWSQPQLMLERLPNSVNSEYDESTPILSRDGKTLYFTRIGSPDFEKTLIEFDSNLFHTLEPHAYYAYLQEIYSRLSQRVITDPTRSPFNQDIWIAHLNEFRVIDVEHPAYPINNALPNSICSLTPFENTFVILNQFPQEGGMGKGYSIIQHLGDSSWAYPEAITIKDYYNLQEEVNMTMSSDGAVIIFSMTREDSYGKNDLYVSFRETDNTWSAPMNLGFTVNTHHRELTPFLSDDTKTLYFSSDRRSSKGGKDIFMVQRLDDSWRKWSRPSRYKSPINSKYDESQPYFCAATGHLYFTSEREGSSDIYRVQIAPPNPVTVTVKGRVLHAKTRKPIGAKIYSFPETNPDARNSFVTEDGFFSLAVPKGTKLVLSPEKMGYRPVPDTVFFKKSYVYYKAYQVTLLVDPITVGMQVDLAPIFFERSKPIILEKSYAALDELAAFLKANEKVRIRVEGHTDNQGSDEALMALSEARAAAIKSYLTEQQSINGTRIETIGFGDRRPLNDNSTEELRSQNRRVEVLVIGLN